jgi:hypothetical protein
MKALLSEILADDGGNLSSSRAAMMLTVTLVLLAWLLVSLEKRELQNIPENVLYFVGITVGAKTVQKFGENKTPPLQNANGGAAQ